MRGSLEALEQDWHALGAEHRSGGLASEGAAFVYRDEAFHQHLAAASGNDVAAGILRDIGDRIRILRIHDFTSDDRIGATIAEHLEILAAILAGDADDAAGYMRAHIQRSAQVVRERIGEALARMFEGRSDGDSGATEIPARPAAGDGANGGSGPAGRTGV